MTANITNKLLANWKLIFLTVIGLTTLGLLSGNLIPNTLIVLSLLFNSAFVLALIRRQLTTDKIKFGPKLLQDLKTYFLSLLAASAITIILFLVSVVTYAITTYLIHPDAFMFHPVAFHSLSMLTVFCSPLFFVFSLSAWLTYSQVKDIQFDAKKAVSHSLVLTVGLIIVINSFIVYVGSIEYEKGRRELIKTATNQIEELESNRLYENRSHLERDYFDDFKQLEVAKELKGSRKEIIEGYKNIKRRLKRKPGLSIFTPSSRGTKLIPNAIGEIMVLGTRHFYLTGSLSIAQYSYQQLIEQKRRLGQEQYEQWLKSNLTDIKNHIKPAFEAIPHFKEHYRDLHGFWYRQPSCERVGASEKLAGIDYEGEPSPQALQLITIFGSAMHELGFLGRSFLLVLCHTKTHKAISNTMNRNLYFTGLYINLSPAKENLWDNHKVNESLESKWVRYKILKHSYYYKNYKYDQENKDEASIYGPGQ